MINEVLSYRRYFCGHPVDRGLDWAAAQNNLGNALATLGERESGTARLEEAVAAHREALKEGRASACRSTGR
jgi:Tetratricopeptide repeat